MPMESYLNSCLIMDAMALFEMAVEFFRQNITVFYSLFLTYAFYLALKLTVTYQKKHDSKYLFIATFVLIGAFYLWSKIYEQYIKAFFEQFQFLLVLIPLSIFLISSIMENRRAKENEEKKKLRGAFQQYVSPDIVEEITKNPDKLKLGGDKKVLSVFFSDIRGFTTLSEKMNPEELVSFLNQYLSKMTDIVLENKGLVDKYIGDAIMAFWGAPMDNADHAIDACTAAIRMKKKMVEFSEECKKKGLPEIKIGMGINTGDMVVGNMGSDKRFDYTVIGDNVNLASRLESLTKQYHIGINISQTTFDMIKGKGFSARQMDLVAVKGKTKPVKIYELIGFEKELSKKELELVKEFDEGVDLYLGKKWKEALKIFEECRQKHNDETSDVYIERCKEFIKNPPAKEWDGVFIAKSK